MDIYKQSDTDFITVKFSAEDSSDNAFLRFIIEQVNVRELTRRKVGLQKRLSEAYGELDRVKRSWAYRVLNFISFG